MKRKNYYVAGWGRIECKLKRVIRCRVCGKQVESKSIARQLCPDCAAWGGKKDE